MSARKALFLAASAAGVFGFLVSGCAPSQQEATPEVAESQSSSDPAAEDLAVSYESYYQAVGSCMQEEGWDVTAYDDHVEGFSPTGQGEAYNVAMAACLATNEDLEPILADVDEPLLRLNYARYEAAIACLDQIPYVYSELPSYGVWAEQQFTSDIYILFPLNTNPDENEEVAETCPDPGQVFQNPEIEIYSDSVDYPAYWAGVDGSQP